MENTEVPHNDGTDQTRKNALKITVKWNNIIAKVNRNYMKVTETR